MADLIAKVSRSSTNTIDSSGVYSHAISQLASGHHDTHLPVPAPAKVAAKHPYNICDSDVELNDIMYGKEFAPGAGFETEEDTRPLKHGKEAWESQYGVAAEVHTTVWSCESGMNGC